MKIDRRKGPAINTIRDIQLPAIETAQLTGGSPVYFIQTPSAPVVRLEIVIDAGRLKERAPLESRAAAALLKDGTLRFSREELASISDRTGGAISINAGLEYASIQVHCLEDQIDVLLDLIRDMLTAPLYRPEDLRKYKRRKKSKLKRDLSINEVLAYRKLTEMIFGPQHPYGYNSSPEMYDALDPVNLTHFHREHYRTGNMQLFLCCRNPVHIIRKIEGIWSGLEQGSTADFQFELEPSPENFAEIRAVQKSQTSLKMGLELFSRNHSDFPAMYFVNTLLGGFFGSRLVREIRETKGLTYSVFSSMETFRNSGFFVIGCETSPYRAEKVISLIESELDRLRNVAVPEEELLLVKNYLFGFFTSLLDGPVNTIELVKVLVTEGAGLDFFYEMMHEFRNIDSKRVAGLVNRHLNPSDLKTVLVRGA